MVEMAYGLPYKHEDSTITINLVDVQLELDLSQSPFAKEQETFEMMRILNEECVEHSKGKKLDLELLLNRIGSDFKPIKDETRKMSPYKQHFRNKFARTSTRVCKGRTWVANRAESESDSKLIGLILLKAEI